MNVYIYQADLYCEDCGAEIRSELTLAGKAPADPENEYSYDSDDFPKGPFPDGEADCPQHCGACDVFLENPLTSDGYAYVREMLIEGHSEIVSMWAEFYEVSLTE